MRRALRWVWYDVRDMVLQAAHARSREDLRILWMMAGWRVRCHAGDAWRALVYGVTRSVVWVVMTPCRAVAVLTGWALSRATEDKRVCEKWRRFRDDAYADGQRLIALTPERWTTSRQYAWARGAWLLACQHEALAFRRWQRWYRVARVLVALERASCYGVRLALRALTFVQGRRWADVQAQLEAPSC